MTSVDGVDPGGALGLRLDELVRELPLPATIVGDAAARVLGVHHDSRAVERGDLFVARAGARFDGARFVSEAVERGAAAILARSGTVQTPAPVPVVFADDLPRAFAHAASAVYGHPSFALDVVGITGTNGKTTTAHLVRAAVDGALGRVACGVLGTVGHRFGSWHCSTEHTTPEADDLARALARMRALGATHAVMEVSSHALELGRVQGIHFRAAALTNLTQDHLDFHGSMAAYAAAKAKLFTEHGVGQAVLNVDDPFGRDLLARVRRPAVRVSSRPDATSETADIAPRAFALRPRGIEATVRAPRGDVALHSRMVGSHNLDNLLLALGVACALDLDVQLAADALSKAPAPPGRLERCDAETDDIVVLVDYAHTPDALARALEAVRGSVGGRLWCVFGCGGDRDRSKRGPMGRAAASRADVVVVTSDNPRGEDPHAIALAVVAGVREAGVEPRVELDRRAAIELAVTSAGQGDVVVIAGKGHEDYQVVGSMRHPFDDCIEARRALERRRAGAAVGGR